MSKLTATWIYSGLTDYWGGNGKRWDDNNGCLFASYGTNTSVRDLVDQLVDDFNAGGDCVSMHKDIRENDVRAALLGMMSDVGRIAYASGALSEYSIEYAKANSLEAGVDLDDQVNDEDRCLYDESPVIIILLESTICSECGDWAEHSVNDICSDCEENDGDLDEWECDGCDNSACCSSDDYLEVGVPFCAECNREMNRVETAK